MKLPKVEYGHIIEGAGPDIPGVWDMEILLQDCIPSRWSLPVPVHVVRRRLDEDLWVIVPTGYAHPVETFGEGYRFTYQGPVEETFPHCEEKYL